MKILILSDGKAGHENQSRALARALGFEADVLEVHFLSSLAKAKSYLYDHLNFSTLSLFSVKGALPDFEKREYAAVIGTGSGTFYAAKALARKLQVKCGVVLYPRGYNLKTFDCILAPAFDRPKAAPNIIRLPANLVAADGEFYRRGTDEFRRHYAAITGKALGPDADSAPVAVVVGGANKCSMMSAKWIKKELEKIFAAHRATPNVQFWVTTSRRTSADVERVVAGFPWDYRLLYSQDHFNPIPGFVSLARTLYVTAESTGMLSEACSFGSAEVHALDNLKKGRNKFRRFVENLNAMGALGGKRKIDLSAQFARAKTLLAL